LRRRELIAVAAGAALPAGARAQPAPAVIGYLSSKNPAAEAVIVRAAREGLAKNGFVEGRNLSIDFGWSDGDYSRLPRLAAELVERKVSLIMSSGLPATLAARKATSTIPIVFRLAIDPVAYGLAQSLSRPGGDLTGVTMLFDPLTPKKVQLLQELVPGIRDIGFLVNPKNQNVTSHRQRAEEAVRTLGLRLVVLTASTPDELETAFARARQEAVSAVLVGDDPFFDVSSRELVAAAARHAMPTMFYVRDFVEAGGLISYGASFDEMAYQAGDYAGRILKGARPADLPIGQPTKIELVINMKTARALGLAVPQSLMGRADTIVE
jgi:putative ABC transport system substrate-binding protein